MASSLYTLLKLELSGSKFLKCRRGKFEMKDNNLDILVITGVIVFMFGMMFGFIVNEAVSQF